MERQRERERDKDNELEERKGQRVKKQTGGRGEREEK